MQKPERSLYTPQDFLQWRETGILELTPKFQRRGVWKPSARSYFIDTLLRQMPVPPIYIRVVQADDHKKSVRQVIDGQQRISCVLDYLDGKFRLSRVLPSPWAGKSFDNLNPDQQQKILATTFSTELFQGISDAEVLQIFARLNTYSVPLNAQELRNGRFFGVFKQSAYELSHEHLEFWRRHNVFSEQSIARMLEVELTSELIIAQIAGMQDKKGSIDQFYKNYDDAYVGRAQNERRFRTVVDAINETFEEGLGDTEFSRPPLFYSLFCAIYHRLYGLPDFKRGTPKRDLNKVERVGLLEAVRKLSDLIDEGREGVPLGAESEKFVTACLRQTDNIKPRKDRLRYLYKSAFNE